jgi:hypothetical protein
MDVNEMADKVMASGLSLAHDMDEVVAMVREVALNLDEPEASWFMADVLNEVNEREMAME